METRDLRLYKLEEGQLKKVGIGIGGHRFDTMEEIDARIQRIWNNPHRPNPEQIIIMEYFAPYKAKIIEVINKPE